MPGNKISDAPQNESLQSVFSFGIRKGTYGRYIDMEESKAEKQYDWLQDNKVMCGLESGYPTEESEKGIVMLYQSSAQKQ